MQHIPTHIRGGGRLRAALAVGLCLVLVVLLCGGCASRSDDTPTGASVTTRVTATQTTASGTTTTAPAASTAPTESDSRVDTPFLPVDPEVTDAPASPESTTDDTTTATDAAVSSTTAPTAAPTTVPPLPTLPSLPPEGIQLPFVPAG